MPHVPTSVQFELTYACNNACRFCYNAFGSVELPRATTVEIKRALSHLAQAGVFSVNFNGGEPLLHEDFFEIADHAAAIGLELHLNTNCTTIGRTEAKHLARYFRSACTTILSAESSRHDELSGRQGALVEAEQGIRALQDERVYVAANVTLCRANATEIVPILTYLHSLDVRTALITRVVTQPGDPQRLALADDDLELALRAVIGFQKKQQAFARIAFPQPYPPCRFGHDIRTDLRRYNIPCTIGLNTARITPHGDVTPCALVREPCIGNAIETPFAKIWEHFDGESFFGSCLPQPSCRSCADLKGCGGGCFGSNHAFTVQK